MVWLVALTATGALAAVGEMLREARHDSDVWQQLFVDEHDALVAERASHRALFDAVERFKHAHPLREHPWVR